MTWYRNAGTGDNPGTRVNLDPDRPKFHKPREDWVRSGLALCGQDIQRPGFHCREPDTGRGCTTCKAIEAKLS